MHDGPENHVALEQASDYFHDAYSGSLVHLYDLRPVHDCCDAVKRNLTPEELRQNGFTVHGGIGEHSELLFLRPELVASGIHNAPNVTAEDFPDMIRIAHESGWPGYWGAPRYATAAIGAASFHAISDKMNSVALQILDGLDWRKLPRFSDEQVQFIRSAGQELTSDYDRQRRKREVEWLKSKNLQ